MKLLAGVILLLAASNAAAAQELFEYRPLKPRWISPENPTGAAGEGGRENRGAKGHPFDTLPAGQSLVLGEIKGAGVIRRMWITINDRSPEMLRALRLEMYWDGASTPAVAVPLGDFFGAALGEIVPFENALFSSPEGRSFNTSVPMPFRHSARIVLTNESAKDLAHVFYDIDYTLGEPGPGEALYFHAYWHRQRPTALGESFRILPRVTGRGRYLGAAIGVITDPVYEKTWWGEGALRIYLDGDAALPTLVGTGTEDAIGSGWGQGVFVHRYQGSLVADEARRHWSFYRLHVPDAIFFDRACEVSLQQIGGAPKSDVLRLQSAGVALTPITIDAGDRPRFAKLLEPSGSAALASATGTDWVNFYRRDDVSATAYFYLDTPGSDLPPLAPVAERVAGLK